MKKKVLVTASSKGLGLHIAKALSYEGYSIILTSRSQIHLQEAQKELNGAVEHESIVVDFQQPESVNQLIMRLKDQKLYGLIHNFGVNFEGDGHPINKDILSLSIEANFMVALTLNNALYSSLDGNPSKIIHIGSTATLHAKASPCYTLSKGLINTYVKNSAAFYLEHNIAICSVLPGILAHDGSIWDKKRLTQPSYYERTEKNQPLGRFALPNDIVSYVVDLVNQNSLMHTGSCIKLDANDY